MDRIRLAVVVGLWVCVAGLLIGLAVGVTAQETVSLTTPVTFASRSSYTLERLTLDVAAGSIHIQLVANNKDPVSCNYNSTSNPTGATLITALNKANFSSTYANNAITGSLAQRIFHRLVIMGEASAVCGQALVGTLTGSPQ